MYYVRYTPAFMANKVPVQVRLDSSHVRLLDDLAPLYGNTTGEIARFLLVEALVQKHGLERLREKRAIK